MAIKKFKPTSPALRQMTVLVSDEITCNQPEKSLLVSALKSKWLNYYFLEKSNLKRIKSKRDEIIKAKLGSGVQKSILPLKNTDRIANEDEQVQKLDMSCHTAIWQALHVWRSALQATGLEPGHTLYTRASLFRSQASL